MPKDPLAREQEMVVQVACHALTRTIQQYSPVGTDTLPIAAVAISRMLWQPEGYWYFVDLRQNKLFRVTPGHMVGHRGDDGRA